MLPRKEVTLGSVLMFVEVKTDLELVCFHRQKVTLSSVLIFAKVGGG